MAGRDDPDWVGAAEIAEYAYCPRAFWYSRHRPDAIPPPRSARSQSRGEAFHAREGRAQLRERPASSATGWALLLVALLLLAGLLFLVGAL